MCQRVILVTVVLAMLVPQTVVAQELGNETVTETPDEQITDQLGDLVVHEYSYADGSMIIEATWTGRAPVTVTLTEMLELDSGGTTGISFQQQRLAPDEPTELTIAAEERTGGTAAVLVTTPQATDRGEALVLQSGSPSTWPSIGLDSAILATGASAALASAVTFVLVVRRRRSEEQGVDRIA